jgi:hypothetical protein
MVARRQIISDISDELSSGVRLEKQNTPSRKQDNSLMKLARVSSSTESDESTRDEDVTIIGLLLSK